MSLLYECINGIIQGGILEAVEDTAEGEEVAKLCVGKLRGMMLIQGDTNCKPRPDPYHNQFSLYSVKYVALLAFDKIVRSHPHLVSEQQDVILECIDDPDISIRMRALDLVVGMVDNENLTAIVGRLMRQLRNAPIVSPADDPANDRGHYTNTAPNGEDDDSDAEESLRRAEQKSNQAPALPEDYRISVIQRILDMCSRDTYSNLTDFDWYIDVLVQLVRVAPATTQRSVNDDSEEADFDLSDDVGRGIGRELQNVAVRVKSVRPEVVDAAQSLVLVDKRDKMFPSSGNGGQGVLEYAAWLVGEYARYLTNPDAVMTSLLHSSATQLPSRTLAIYIQAIPKIFASIAGNEQLSWTPERKTLMELLMARIIHFLEPLATHPSLEVQERAVEYLELIRLAAEAASGTPAGHDYGQFTDPPLLLTQAIPGLFSGAELNPVASGAQSKVPVPEDLDLDTPINSNLQSLLRQAEYDDFTDADEDDVYAAYSEPPTSHVDIYTTASERLDVPKSEPASYQNAAEEEYLDPDILARRKAERRERYKDDPFYIDPDRERGSSGSRTPLRDIIKSNNGEELDIDAIPVMDLDLGGRGSGSRSPAFAAENVPASRRKAPRTFEITADETLGSSDSLGSSSREDLLRPSQLSKGKKSLLQVDSSGLGALSLEDNTDGPKKQMSKLDIERKEAEEAEMAKALKEVERLRLEMQRASERIQAKGPEGGVVVRRKKKKVREVALEGEGVEEGTRAEGGGDGAVMKKKKKKKVRKEEGEGGEGVVVEATEGTERLPKKKKKKRRQVVIDEGIAPEEQRSDSI